ncbi:winged helix-turn-helix transcriptional regulator [Verticiella sediminum]|uniref:Winged helix-turn-helix transcriptional regulator n=2 Tax=Verticiella sediminum TaxID=1247510 RepID=A0A556A6N3_9BURK|nr:winged helix-turn-helix transcriptional regulator [Verticiella sediminum]
MLPADPAPQALPSHAGAPASALAPASLPEAEPGAASASAGQLEQARSRSPLLVRPGFLIRRLHQIHTALFLEETQEFGITPVQYSLMTALARRGEMDQISIAREVGLERTTVAEVLTRLHARGLVTRRADPHDRRVRLVKLARAGRSLVKKMAPAVQRAHDRTLEPLPPAERDEVMLKLIRLVEANNDAGAVQFRL